MLDLNAIYIILKILGGISTFTGLTFGVFKVITWIKNKFNNIDANVVALKSSMDTHINGLREDIKTQTTTLANALSEQRADFRTFYAPTLLLLQQHQQALALPTPARAKRVVRKKKQG
jgi:hypothetical protein